MRRLLSLVSLLVAVDTMLYAALTPMLPRFAHELSLGKGQAGALVAWTLRVPPAPAARTFDVSPTRALANDRFAGGLALMVLASLLFGILSVLAPLHLSAAGWGAGAIGAIWLVGAALEAVESPLVGRISDRRG